MKVSALDEPDQVIEAPAKVFNQEDIIDAIKRETINQYHSSSPWSVSST